MDAGNPSCNPCCEEPGSSMALSDVGQSAFVDVGVVELHGELCCLQDHNTITVPEWQAQAKKEGPQALNSFFLPLGLAASQRS